MGCNGGLDSYRACEAHQTADQRTCRPVPVSSPLVRGWPASLAAAGEATLAGETLNCLPADEGIWISQETIYRELYLQDRGTLREELTEGRGKRGKLTNVVEISDRPAEADGKSVPGHWKVDLLLGR